MSSIHIKVHSAEGLRDVENFGKNDPYLQVSLDFEKKNSFKKTSVKKNAGKNPEWNEEIILNDYEPNEHHYLYVEILDQEKLADAVIGYGAIPLRQVISAGGSYRGKFEVYDDESKPHGAVSLTISILSAGQQAPASSGPEVQGETQIVNEHKDRIKLLENKEDASDAAVAAAIFGAGFAYLKSGGKKEVKKEN
ncbi:hypothetical protein BX616_002612 [Lobosporangium transversale]|uniref:C2 domain-containing protein n=1 Tax=Lobosporangium transversale TaxID=64571 RepID=A0A1Y2GTU6_9FUNG|nr:C2 domain-containing protein [Lobosporangium transversale]KAF9900363.1 hypothetical protein BX616_002612 [Lobosporangium transversale]ORZ22920.1 C2 domain-containing protein [Lobosporangium transversale]|eukprot:XP_021883474.1 C2 domain-containing protein [Lobosporangium transversale]